MALEGAVPAGDAPAPATPAAPVESGDYGTGDGPSLADMEAFMTSPDATAGAGDAAVVPADAAPPAAAADATAAAPAPVADAAAADPVAPAEPAAPVPAPAELAAEAVKLRKGWASLARDKEALVAKTNEANAAIESSKVHRAKAEQLDQIPAQFKADPIAFMFKLAGAETVDQQESFMTALLDRVIETEKSPMEREFARLKGDLAAKEAAAEKARADAAATAKEAENQRVIAQWEATNTGFAASTPENVKKYDLINNLDMGAAVHQTCVNYHKKYGVILDAATAADYVEKHFRAGVDRSEYVKSKFAAPSPAPARTPSNGTAAPKQSGATNLSQLASGDGASSTPAIPEELEGNDRFEAVMRDLSRENQIPNEWLPR